VAADGSVYVAGSANDAIPGQVSGGSGFSDGFVRKYDAAGNVLWTRQSGTAGIDSVNAIATDATGVYLGGFYDTGGFNFEIRVQKYDANGTELWTRQVGTDGGDTLFALEADANGVYVGGSTTGTLPGQTSSGGTDGFVRAYDAAGNDL
jgi:hypothetical protein